MSGIYIHIPFCKKRCHYCDFFSTTGQESQADYVESICKEAKLRNKYLLNNRISTIYFGGGTPSQLETSQVRLIIDSIKENFDTSNCQEITFELNPDDITYEYLISLKEIGINRLSIGIQSFDDEILKRINRRHNSKQAIESVKLAQRVGFNNISIDLMYGLPGQNIDIFRQSLEIAVGLNIQHISSYHLTYEEGTVLYKWLKEGVVSEPNEELSLRYFELLIDSLRESGFRHYEISNFALPNRESKHNSSYWEGTPYLGLGASSHSYNGSERSWNASSIKTYMNSISCDELACEKETIDQTTSYNDYIITSLRTSRGINIEYISDNFGEKLKQHTINTCKAWLKTGKLKWGYGLGVSESESDEVITLSRDGIFLSDAIMEELIYV
ncbi:MAG: radical SAM family heme chaperone HemW [Bacteroidales bacterium]